MPMNLLLAIIDLYSHSHYSAYISHNAVADTFIVDHIVQTYQEAVNIPDPRWLLSFCTPLLSDNACSLQPKQVRQCLTGLTTKGLLQKAATGNELSFTVPGIFLAESFHRRISLVGLNVAGANETGVIGSHSGLFIRSDEPIWYCDIRSDDKVTVLGADMNMVRQILDAVLTPLAVPPLKFDIKTPQVVSLESDSVVTPISHPKTSTETRCKKCGNFHGKEAEFCGKCGTPLKKSATPPLPPKAMACAHCNKKLKRDAKFCGGCGMPV